MFKFHTDGISDTHEYYMGGSVQLDVPEESQSLYANALYTIPQMGWNTPDGWGRFTSIGDAFYSSYRIYDPEDLDMLHRYNSLEFNYKGQDIKRVYLERDIDMSGYTWNGGIGAIERYFSGSFYGQGYTISNLTVYTADPENGSEAAGLFGHFDGERISNVRLKDCRFSHPKWAGGVVGYLWHNTTEYHYDTHIDSIFIDNCIIEGNLFTGGLVGRTADVGRVFIKDCFISNSSGVGPYTIGESPCAGSLIGRSYWTRIRNCAVPIYPSHSESTFVSNSVNDCDADSCYTLEYQTIPSGSESKYHFGQNMVYRGTPFIYYAASGQEIEHTFDRTYMQGFYLVPYLGTDCWAYKYNEFLMPSCFVDRWEVEKNKFVITPLHVQRVNGLTPAEPIPEDAWHTNDEDRSFHRYSFTSQRLWFDESISPDVMDRPNVLPIGIGTITATSGVQYSRVIQAANVGDKYVKEPELIDDGQGNFVETGDSVSICIGRDYTPVGYSLYLPYNLRLPSSYKIYQPREIISDDGQTTVRFRLLDTDVVEAFTPYYVVIEAGSLPLSTQAEAVFPPNSHSTDITLSGYRFVGTAQSISNYTASNQNAYILQRDGCWHKVVSDGDSEHIQANIPAFRAYFRSTGTGSSAPLRVIFDDGELEATGMEALNVERLTFNDGEVYDLSGRRVATLPLSGGAGGGLSHRLYIINGKKVFVK